MQGLGFMHDAATGSDDLVMRCEYRCAIRCGKGDEVQMIDLGAAQPHGAGLVADGVRQPTRTSGEACTCCRPQVLASKACSASKAVTP
jgi:hypothetical protein